MNDKISELMQNMNFSLVPYGPNKGKMQITAKTIKGKGLYNELVNGMWKAEIAEIKAGLIAKRDAERAAAAERKAKIDAIEGLNEIQTAIVDWERYDNEFQKMMDDEHNDGARPPKRPTSNVGELLEKYPRAAAYLTAKEFSHADHYVKVCAGETALEKIINGEDYVAAIAAMKKEWHDYCDEHMWD